MSFYALAALCATALALVAAQDLELRIPELDIPVLDPFFTEKEHTKYQVDDINADITVMNVNTYGLAKMKFLAVRPTYADDFYKLEVDVEVPKVLIEGNYKAAGSMGAFQIGGEGFFNISMEDIKATFSLEGSVANDRWTIEHFNLNPEVGKMKIWFSDIFNGNEGLNKAALQFVNEYWPSLYRSMLPFVAQNWDERFTELGNNVFSKISFSKTFP
ncbi:hypothetical protein EAI_14886 [Harpegnathos saltator]|uniref:Circadian clock-controlled protein n=1 Tax=Harpegnathos saltator TaxID=610380 RepID=E2BGV8_HARSA|nr:hypothetical protein EAI_14886 [Harpegnathos saltator]